MARTVYKRTWRERVSLSAYLTTLIVFVISFISIILAYHVFSILKENKYRDITSIMFLELEKQAHYVKQRLDAYENEIMEQTDYMKNPESADVILKFSDKKNLELVKGQISGRLSLKDFGVEKQENISQIYLLQLAGKTYFARRLQFANTGNTYLYLWNINLGKLSGLNNRVSNESQVYILSREFKLMFRNSPSIKEEGLITRKLIQNFIATSIRKGQFKFRKDDSNYYGFYAEIPGTNIVLFSETSERVITDKILGLLKTFAIGVLIILCVTILLVQIILPSVTRPLRELVKVARFISMGRFKFATNAKGFGEVNELIRAFSRMGQDLEARDKEIMTLMQDKEERARLDQELLIAKKIQENFLPQSMQSPKEGVYIGSFYQPADEVAGDWYQQFYDQKTDEFIAIIADVSGHGAGASMFTAVIAAQFEEFKISRGASYDIYSFINNLNTIFKNLGKGEWHATLLVCTVSSDRKMVNFINCGHPFPLVLHKNKDENKVVTIKMPSTPIGLEEVVKLSEKSITIDGDTSLLFFTDGIIEAENPDEKPYGRKRLSLNFEGVKDLTPSHVVNQIFKSWKEFIKDNKPKDDICLYSLGIKV